MKENNKECCYNCKHLIDCKIEPDKFEYWKEEPKLEKRWWCDKWEKDDTKGSKAREFMWGLITK